MGTILVTGLQWGDEGKGKIVDILSEKADVVVRSQGGNNAGHTVFAKGQEFRFHLIPSGILYPQTRCFVAGGTVVNPKAFLEEIATLKKQGIDCKGRLFLSYYAHVIFPYHQILDKLWEEKKGKLAVGTTGRGIGPCYADKANRIGLRIADLISEEQLREKLKIALHLKNEELKKIFNKDPLSFEEIFQEYAEYGKKLKEYACDVEREIFEAERQKKKIVLEGAHGSLLDTTFGTYPFVTSSSTIASGICLGAGMGSAPRKTIGVLKSYFTRVGNGPFPTELSEEEYALFPDRSIAREVGTTTGRIRRMGWFDAPLAKYTASLNGISSVAITKLDILDGLSSIKICTGYRFNGKMISYPPALSEELAKVEPIYEEMPGWKRSTRGLKDYAALPKEAKTYVERLSSLIGAELGFLSFGPDREETIALKDF
ncbi:MAG TPA: adenylosuccinate synthase [Chlamydiales bacterium]|nr:adenylosuccinate synthase [Chlamydiales bacterium]